MFETRTYVSLWIVASAFYFTIVGLVALMLDDLILRAAIIGLSVAWWADVYATARGARSKQ